MVPVWLGSPVLELEQSLGSSAQRSRSGTNFAPSANAPRLRDMTTW
jgi:hypothetical protein